MIEINAIPGDLKALPQWVGWRVEVRDGKPTKPPYSPRTGGYASHANPHTWTTFDAALAFADKHSEMGGIGFVFTKDDEYAGIDLDKCRDPETGELEGWARTIVSELGSYTEVSPNGTGLHVIVCGRLPNAVKRAGVEMYDRLRYFTVTGQHVTGTPPTIERRYDELLALYEEVSPKRSQTGTGPYMEPTPVDVDDVTLLERARNSEKVGSVFRALYDRGEWQGAYASQSSADLALCSYLAFWTNREATRMDRMFRSSALMRPKWDETHFADGRTYGQGTVGLAIEGVSQGYEPSESAPIIDEADWLAAQAEQEQEREGAQEQPASEPDTYRAPVEPGSFIGEYVDYASMRTDAPPVAHELMSVGILSALAGPGPSLNISTHLHGWGLGIWVMYVVDSTVGRKSTVLNFAVDVVETVLGREAIIPWEGSPQGIIQRLQERDGKSSVFVRDEYSGLMKQMKHAGGHMAGLEQTFIRAYDGGVIENIRTRKKSNKKDQDGNIKYEKDTDRVEHPYLVKLTASTRLALVERCSIDDVISGFLPRFVFVSGSATPQPLQPATAEIWRKREAVIAHARAFCEKAQRVKSIPVADAVFGQAWALETAWQRTAKDMARPEAGTPSLKRLAETVLKVAALIAIDECRDLNPTVQPQHFGQAYRLAERWIEHTIGLIDELGSTTFMRETDAVALSVTGHPGITLSDLLRTHRRVRSRDFEEILKTLEAREIIERREVKTAGRARTVFFPYGFTAKTGAGEESTKKEESPNNEREEREERKEGGRK